jgi:hypothetical protein
MRSRGLYVYGFVPAASVPDPSWTGLEHEGVPAPVRALRVGTVAALVSAYDHRRRALPLRRNLDPHQRVIRQAMKVGTIVPMAFGHVARREEDVLTLLRDNAGALTDELARLAGKVEGGLKILWDVEDVFRHLVDADPVLAAFRDQIFDSTYPASRSQKIELGRMFDERREEERGRLTEDALAALLPIAVDVCVNVPIGDRTVADVAFLLAQEAWSDFEARVRRVASEWPRAFAFQCSGPWAPFHFVELELAAASAEDEAC